jgi:large conductance mechanosensitive channel
MSLLQEFKKFAIKGNVVDLAVAVVIGTAFGKVVSSLVADIVMPPLGLLIGGVDFSALAITLKEATNDDPAVVIAYGNFIQTVVNFLVIAGAVFVAVKAINTTRRKEEKVPPPAPPGPSAEEKLLTEIRDILKNKP